MSENLATRITRLISANINDLFDKMEQANADSILRETIREIEQASDDVREELGKVMYAQKQASNSKKFHENKLDDLHEKIKFAVAQDRDDLAEAAISRQMNMEMQIKSVDKTLKKLHENQMELEGFLTALQSRQDEMTSEMETYLANRETVSGQPAKASHPSKNPISKIEKQLDKSERAFNRVLKGYTPDAKHTADRAQSVKMSELDQLEREDEIANRLASIKAEQHKIAF